MLLGWRHQLKFPTRTVRPGIAALCK